MPSTDQERAEALARLYDLDVSVDPGDIDLYLALADRAGGPVVELCSGSGRVAVPLAAAGHDVTAVDSDRAMLDRAATRVAAEGPDAVARLHPVFGDLRSVSVDGAGTFRLGIIALNSLLLLGGPRQQRDAIAILAGLLAPGGLAVVDTWIPLADDLARYDGRLGLEWVRRDPETGSDVVKTTSAWYDSATRAVTLTSIFDESAPGEPICRWIREDALHLIAATELRLHAEDAGLEIEVVAGGYDLVPIEPGDGRAVLVAHRPPGP
ncbi:MAG: class I SAM-dependent methyltransferase [Chloroflexota bacterium]